MKKLILILFLISNVSFASTDFLSKVLGGWAPVYYPDTFNYFKGLENVGAQQGDLHVNKIRGSAGAVYTGDVPKYFKMTWGGSVYAKPNLEMLFCVFIDGRNTWRAVRLVAPSEQRWIALSIDEIVYLKPGQEVDIRLYVSEQDQMVVNGAFNIFSLD